MKIQRINTCILLLMPTLDGHITIYSAMEIGV